jgi:hypothetical protein
MSKLLVSIISTLVVSTLATPASAGATDVGTVMQICDSIHDSGGTCTIGIKGNSLVGCTPGYTFDCPADGSRQCSGEPNPSGKCNDDGTAARTLPGSSLVDKLKGELDKLKGESGKALP